MMSPYLDYPILVLVGSDFRWSRRRVLFEFKAQDLVGAASRVSAFRRDLKNGKDLKSFLSSIVSDGDNHQAK